MDKIQLQIAEKAGKKKEKKEKIISRNWAIIFSKGPIWWKTGSS